MASTQHEIDTLLAALIDHAKDQLRRRGVFAPTLGAIDADGATRLEPIDLAGVASAAEATARVESAARTAAATARAVGVVVNAPAPKGSGRSVDAMVIRLEHQDAEAMTQAIPYRRTFLTNWDFGAPVIERRTPQWFAGSAG